MTVDGACPQLDAEITQEVSTGNHDSSFDLDLRVGLVQLGDYGFSRLDVLGYVGNDQTVRALVYLNYASGAEPAADYLKQPAALYAGSS